MPMRKLARSRQGQDSARNNGGGSLCIMSVLFFGLLAVNLLKPIVENGGQTQTTRSMKEQGRYHTTTVTTAATANLNAGAEESKPKTIHNDNNNNNDDDDEEWWEREQPLLKDWPYLHARNDIHPWLEKLGYSRGVEVGVQRGLLARRTLLSWRSCKEYKLVDLWGSEENYKEPGIDTNIQKLAHYQNAQRILKPWTDQGITEFFKMRSTDAVTKFEDDYFDYVYIDARHDYCAVQEDIQAYWPKVRPGGILAGHDYITAPEAMAILGPAKMEDWSQCEDGREEPRAVKGAVDDFAAKHGLEIVTTHEGFDTWLLQKPYETANANRASAAQLE